MDSFLIERLRTREETTRGVATLKKNDNPMSFPEDLKTVEKDTITTKERNAGPDRRRQSSTVQRHCKMNTQTRKVYSQMRNFK